MSRHLLYSLTAAMLLFIYGQPLRAGSDVRLQGDGVSLVFSGGGTYLLKSYSVDGNEMLPAGGSSRAPWSITFLGPNRENPTIEPNRTSYKGVRLSEDGRSAILLWQMAVDNVTKYPIEVTVTLPEGSGMPSWSINIALAKGWSVAELTFPVLSVKADTSARAVIPAYWGTRKPVLAGFPVAGRYPGSGGTMNFAMLETGKHILYFTANEDEGNMKTYSFSRENNNSIVISQKVITSSDWNKGESFTLPWSTTIGFYEGNWQDAVLSLYRPRAIATDWGKRTIRERGICQWMQDIDIWLTPSGVDEEIRNNLMKSLRVFGHGAGVHWYCWSVYPFDTNYPEYFPTKPGFAKMVQEARSLGSYVTPYINGRLWDSGSEHFKTRNGRANVCLKRDGTMYTEIYPSRSMNNVACPASEIWEDILRENAKMILDTLGTDGVYVDQIGCSLGVPCYSTAHNHAPGAGNWWVQTYRRMLPSVKTEIFGPDKAMTSEECTECYIDLFDMQLIVNARHPKGTEIIPIFPLVYSGRSIYCGFTYMPAVFNDGSFRFMTMKSFLWGSQLGWTSPNNIMKEENVKELEMLINLVKVRSGLHDIFVGGRFLGEFVPEGDNPEFDVPGYWKTPVVSGARWIDVKGKKCLLLCNMDTVSHKVTVPGLKGERTVPALSAIKILEHCVGLTHEQ